MRKGTWKTNPTDLGVALGIAQEPEGPICALGRFSWVHSNGHESLWQEPQVPASCSQGLISMILLSPFR